MAHFCVFCQEDTTVDIWVNTKCNHEFHNHCFKDFQMNALSNDIGPEGRILYTDAYKCPLCARDLREADSSGSKLTYVCGGCNSKARFENKRILALHSFGCRQNTTTRTLYQENAAIAGAVNNNQLVRQSTPGNVWCFNCLRMTDHMSRQCPEPQAKTRCGTCGSVASRVEHHHVTCTNKAFVSMPLVHHKPSIVPLRFSFDMGEEIQYQIGDININNSSLVEFTSLNTIVKINDEHKLAFYMNPNQMIDVLFRLNNVDIVRIQSANNKAKVNGSDILENDKTTMLRQPRQDMNDIPPNVIVNMSGVETRSQFFTIQLDQQLHTFMTKPGGSSWIVPHDYTEE